MQVGRDIAAITFPFAVGLTAGIFLCSTAWPHQHLVSAASVCLTLTAALLLLHPHRNTWKPLFQTALIAATFIGTGILTGSAGHLLSVSESAETGWWEAKAIGFGKAMASAIDRIPFENPASNGIIKALVTGERSGIPKEVTAAFRDSGAAHILALSGLHLGIIYGMLKSVMSFMGNSPTARRIKSVTIICCCAFYTAATGCGASIARAFLFILLGETAAVFGRRTSLPGILMTAFLIQTTLDPMSVKDVGFQLSYAAVAGIAFIYPHLRDLWPRDEEKEGILARSMRWIWDSAAMSISCQVTTGPISYAYFGTFPIYFILTNLIALPLTGIIIPASLLTLIASELGCCPEIMTRGTEMLITALSESLKIISTM